MPHAPSVTPVIDRLINAELGRVAPAAVIALAQQLAQRGGPHTAAVLYYGSTLRAEALDGMLDFYVLLDHVGAWHGSRLAAAANRLLPPNVGYVEGVFADQPLRAKYAVMSSLQFRQRMSAASLDTTVWARFCQPCICVWARADTDRQDVAASIQQAVLTAAGWAAVLGPASAPAADYWRALFAHTYVAELRVERAGRALDIVGNNIGRYEALLPAAWQRVAIAFQHMPDGQLAPQLDNAIRSAALRRWAVRRRLGKPLNILRLIKAAFTFDGGIDYVVWKIERHRGVRIALAPWQRRFPLLAAPGLYWQLRKRGILR
jgi:hypothetical protein